MDLEAAELQQSTLLENRSVRQGMEHARPTE